MHVWGRTKHLLPPFIRFVQLLCVLKRRKRGWGRRVDILKHFGKDVIKSLQVSGKMMICFSLITLAHKISHFLQMQINVYAGIRWVWEPGMCFPCVRQQRIWDMMARKPLSRTMHNLTSIENKAGLKIDARTNGWECGAPFAGTWSSLEEWKFPLENNWDSSKPITSPHYNLLNTTVKGDVIEVLE